MALISCQNVSMGYEGKMILEHICFEVNKGDYLCIVGENGSGKSTLIKGLLRLKKTSEGLISFNEGLMANEVGYLPQQTDIQRNFPASVYEVVLSGRLNQMGMRPFWSKQDKKIALEKMVLMGISDLKDQSYGMLSGGQQQRVLLARALCAANKVIILDEPIAGLDPVATSEMYQLIEKINKAYGMTVIMITHDIKEAIRYASHILHIGSDTYYFGKKEDYLCSHMSKNLMGGEQSV